MVILRELLTHMLIAAALLIAEHWKEHEKVTMTEWIAKVRYMCLISKLTAVMRHWGGQSNALNAFKLQWSCFVKSKYSKVQERVSSQVLSIL